MGKEILGSLVTVGIATLLAAGTVACESQERVDRSGGAQTGPHKDSGLQWGAERPHVIRMALDSARGRLWALHGGGVILYDARTEETLQSIRLPGWVWAGEPYACPPGIALGPAGEVVVTSNVVPVLWRVDAATFEVSRHELAVEEYGGREIGFSALAYLGGDDVFLAVNGLDGSVWRIDSRLAVARHLPVSPAFPRACGVRVTLLGVCVQTELGEWRLDITTDGRSGTASPGRCPADSMARR